MIQWQPVHYNFTTNPIAHKRGREIHTSSFACLRAYCTQQATRTMRWDADQLIDTRCNGTFLIVAMAGTTSSPTSLEELVSSSGPHQDIKTGGACARATFPWRVSRGDASYNAHRVEASCCIAASCCTEKTRCAASCCTEKKLGVRKRDAESRAPPRGRLANSDRLVGPPIHTAQKRSLLCEALMAQLANLC